MDFKKNFSSEFKNPETPKRLLKISSLIALFFMAFKAPLDPDLFWHLKTGELMWQYKIIPQTDWYSYTMNDFPWIDHEWLAEIMMFKIKSALGWLGLSAFFALIIIFIFAWIAPKMSINPETKKYPFYTSIILGILGAAVSSLIFGIRPQVLSLLGVALIFYIIKNYQINNKSKIINFLPVLFFLWANMHAGFVLGLALLAIYLVLDKNLSLPAKKNPLAEWIKLYRPLPPESWKKLSWLALLSFIATFINPYGTRIYLEIFRTFSDSYGQNHIIEWLSPNFHAAEGMIFGFYLIFIFIFISIVKKIDMLSFALLPFLMFFSLQASRNIPLFVIISLPLLIRSMGDFEKIFASIMQKKIAAVSLSALLVFFPPCANEIGNVIKTMRSDEELARFGKFPQKQALEVLEKYRNFNQGDVLTDYFWGGYLIKSAKCKVESEKLACEPKIFIDGRMAHWKLPERHILKDYTEIIDLKANAKELIEKYEIKIIFVQKASPLGAGFSFNSEWSKIYEDDLAVLYRHTNSDK